jgi:hypothetical protein
MIVHATVDDLAAEPWGVTADNASVLLRAASRLVDGATVTAVYAVDADGRAIDADVLAALRDATCAQAAVWAALGIDPVKGAADDAARTPVRVSLGTGTVEYERAAGAASAKTEAATTLTAEAVAILRSAGLLTGRVTVYG